MLIADLIKNHAYQKTGNVEYHPVSLDGSEIHAARNGNLERHEVFKIVDRVQCRNWLRHSRPRETYCGCGRMLQGITDEVWKQAEQRISSRFIVYALGFYDLAFTVPRRTDAMGNLQNRPNSKKEYITWIARTGTLAERSWSAPSLTSNIKSTMHEQVDTYTDMQDFDRTALERKNHVAHSREKALLQRPVHGRVTQPETVVSGSPSSAHHVNTFTGPGVLAQGVKTHVWT